jgi:hypothetical protein
MQEQAILNCIESSYLVAKEEHERLTWLEAIRPCEVEKIATLKKSIERRMEAIMCCTELLTHMFQYDESNAKRICFAAISLAEVKWELEQERIKLEEKEKHYAVSKQK